MHLEALGDLVEKQILVQQHWVRLRSPWSMELPDASVLLVPGPRLEERGLGNQVIYS